jgi:hypothetical protein
MDTNLGIALGPRQYQIPIETMYEDNPALAVGCQVCCHSHNATSLAHCYGSHHECLRKDYTEISAHWQCACDS